MATQEFLQEGSTSGQRITRAEQTTPPKAPPLQVAADRFAQRVMGRNPEITGLVRQATGQQAPPDPTEKYADLSLSEGAEALRLLASRRGDLDVGTAGEVSRILRELDF